MLSAFSYLHRSNGLRAQQKTATRAVLLAQS